MCLFRQPKMQDIPAPAPPPAPAPSPVPADVAPMQTADQSRKQLNALRFGLASTIKTSPQGVTGAGPDLAGTMFPGQKNKLGN